MPLVHPPARSPSEIGTPRAGFTKLERVGGPMDGMAFWMSDANVRHGFAFGDRIERQGMTWIALYVVERQPAQRCGYAAVYDAVYPTGEPWSEGPE